jgi:hypothetical protein
VIESFNQDVPFDRFVQEQLRATSFPPRSWQYQSSRPDRHRLSRAGAKALARAGQKEAPVRYVRRASGYHLEGFLGVTLSCARCHDHKMIRCSRRTTTRWWRSWQARAISKTRAAEVFQAVCLNRSPPKRKSNGTRRAKDELTAKQNEADDFLDIRVDKFQTDVCRPNRRLHDHRTPRVSRKGRYAAQVAAEKGLRTDALANGWRSCSRVWNRSLSRGLV